MSNNAPKWEVNFRFFWLFLAIVAILFTNTSDGTDLHDVLVRYFAKQ